ncbi:protein-tyrosine phosphatase-like protein [Lactifluus volemus]|nr:protein-tyrosine phosphatase-like protein [Lactifluus volemus]
MCFSASVSPSASASAGSEERETHRDKQRRRPHSSRARRRATITMDAIRIPKVSNVLCSKSGRTEPGTLHLTAHHLIFSYTDASQNEMWVAYPLINLVTRLPQTLSGQCPISFRCRTFETFSLSFEKDSDATDVFESVKELTVANSVTQLYAFCYTPSPPLSASDGWTVYSPREEFGRMGVGTRSKAWRFTDINKDYAFSPTYPSRLVVPTKISDSTLQYGVKYRSKGRLPALTYLHWANYGSITRSSQPMVGLTNARSIQDEKILEATFTSHLSPESRIPQPVYGATATNLIIDARPTTNANMDHYKECKKAYLGIDNIHSMRDSLNKVVEALRESEALAASVSGDIPGTSSTILPVDRQALRRSGWLRHQAAILEGTLLIVRNVHVNHSHVLIHCSDGWDRTSQLSAVSQLCLDPYYRTTRGFQVLIEKDFVSFGHKFLDRCGHLSSEKFFLAPLDSGGGSADVAQALFASVQNRFSGNHHIKETSPVFHQFLEAVRNIQRQFPTRFEFNELFLRDLHTHLYSCQFGTFLFNSERDRREGATGTVSVWDYMNSPPQAETYVNPDYNPALDDPTNRASTADQGVLLPNPKDVLFWNELYGRGDEEMNGRFVATPAPLPPIASVESLEEDPELAKLSVSPSPSPSVLLPVEESPTPPGTYSPSPTMTPARVPSPLAAGNRTARPSSSELLGSAGGNMRSMWGRLSSGAGAAFSAVQDAYETAREARARNASAGGELQDWGAPSPRKVSPSFISASPTLSAFDPPRITQAVRSSTFSSTSTGPSANPWTTLSSSESHSGLASAAPRESDGIPSLLVDNPWNSLRAPSRTTGARRAPLMSTALPRTDSLPSGSTTSRSGSGLPIDPSVALPTPVKPSVSSRGTTLNATTTSDLYTFVAPAVSLSPSASAGNSEEMDPLGVGMR